MMLVPVIYSVRKLQQVIRVRFVFRSADFQFFILLSSIA